MSADPAYDTRDQDGSCTEDEPDIQNHLAMIRAARIQRMQRVRQCLPRKNIDPTEATVDATTIPLSQLHIRQPRRRGPSNEPGCRSSTLVDHPEDQTKPMRSTAIETDTKAPSCDAAEQELPKPTETNLPSTDIPQRVLEPKNSYIVLTPDVPASPTTSQPSAPEASSTGATTTIEVDEGYCEGYDENFWLANVASRSAMLLGGTRINALAHLRKTASRQDTGNSPMVVRNIPRMRKRTKKKAIRSRASSTSSQASQERYPSASIPTIAVPAPPIHEVEDEMLSDAV